MPEFSYINHIAHKLFSTNNAINFSLYVMSGQKFRDDLLRLFKPCYKNQRLPYLKDNSSSPAGLATISEAEKPN